MRQSHGAYKVSLKIICHGGLDALGLGDGRRDLEARTVGLQADLEKCQKETLSVRQLLEASEASCEEVKGDLAMVQTEVLQLREALHNTSFAREAGEATAGEMTVREQVARAQLKDAEQRITVLEAKLARSGKGEAESSAVLFAAQKELEDLRKRTPEGEWARELADVRQTLSLDPRYRR